MGNETPGLQRYKLVRLLGQGGMGELWEGEICYVPGFTRKCVMKFILPEYAQHRSYIERFTQEALIGLDVSVTHPNIVTTRVFDEWPSGELFLALDFVEGWTLQELGRVRDGNYRMIRRIALDVLSALENLESLGVIHGDLSPANILVNTEGKAYIMDFGLAQRVREGAKGVTPAGLGALPYVSPEVLQKRLATFASDRYCFGVVLYGVITGTAPFGSELMEVLNRRCLSFPEDVPADLEMVVRGLLRAEAQERLSAKEAQVLLESSEKKDGDYWDEEQPPVLAMQPSPLGAKKTGLLTPSLPETKAPGTAHTNRWRGGVSYLTAAVLAIYVAFDAGRHHEMDRTQQNEIAASSGDIQPMPREPNRMPIASFATETTVASRLRGREPKGGTITEEQPGAREARQQRPNQQSDKQERRKRAEAIRRSPQNLARPEDDIEIETGNAASVQVNFGDILKEESWKNENDVGVQHNGERIVEVADGVLRIGARKRIGNLVHIDITAYSEAETRYRPGAVWAFDGSEKREVTVDFEEEKQGGKSEGVVKVKGVKGHELDLVFRNGASAVIVKGIKVP